LSDRSARRTVLEAAYVNWKTPANLGSAAYRLRRFSPALFNLIMDRPLLVKTRLGPELRVRLRDAIGPAEVFGLNEYDTELVDWAAARYVIDAGAHVGAFTIWAAARSSCSILAIEPNPAVRRLLEGNVARLGLGERVNVRPWALAAGSGHRHLRPAQDSAGTALVWDPAVGDVEVESVGLQEAITVSGFPEVDLVKMDIEGAEYEVFGAAEDATVRSVRHWIIECHPAPGQDPEIVEARLTGAGFEVRSLEKPHGQRLLIATRLTA